MEEKRKQKATQAEEQGLSVHHAFSFSHIFDVKLCAFPVMGLKLACVPRVPFCCTICLGADVTVWLGIYFSVSNLDWCVPTSVVTKSAVLCAISRLCFQLKHDMKIVLGALLSVVNHCP